MLALDLESFDQIVERVGKIETARRVGTLYMNFVSAQGDRNAIGKFARTLTGNDVDNGGKLRDVEFRTAINGGITK